MPIPERATVNENTGGGQKPRRKSGSEKRRTGRRFTFRMTPEEYGELAANAEREGLTLGSYLRGRLLPVPRTRQRRRPTVEVAALAKLQAEMNRVGSNIHQILKRVNFGETPEADEFRQALNGYREVVAAILAALGRGKP